MLKIRNEIDLKQLIWFGFKEYNDEYIRHYKNDIATFVYKDTRIVEDIDTDYKFLENLNLGESKRVGDLFKAGMLEKIED